MRGKLEKLEALDGPRPHVPHNDFDLTGLLGSSSFFPSRKKKKLYIQKHSVKMSGEGG